MTCVLVTTVRRESVEEKDLCGCCIKSAVPLNVSKQVAVKLVYFGVRGQIPAWESSMLSDIYCTVIPRLTSDPANEFFG